MMRSGSWPSRQLFGISINALTMEQVLAAVDEAIAARCRLLIGVVNVAKIVNMHRDPVLRSSVLEADLVVADGMGVVWASRFLGQSLPERVAGIDLMDGMLARSADRGYRVYCLGATAEVLAAAVDRMRADHPGAQIVGQRDGYFGEHEEEAVAEAIREARADILLVGMTSPKKERFLARWSERMQVPVCHGVGGSFDVAAGKVKRAPAVWQKAGMEWLYRVVQEPGRMWKRYLVTNTLFAGMVATGWMRRVFRSGA